MTKQGSRRYQKANYRDAVRPAVNVYNHRVSATTAYRTEFGRPGPVWGKRGPTPADLSCLAQAARAAGRGFTYARVAKRTGRVSFVVPVFSPL